MATILEAKEKAARAIYDSIVIGAGPNGLSAAIALAKVGMSVLLVESAETIGGGCRSAALTLPGFTHDICSSIHPLAIGSPFFRTLPLNKYGLNWVHPNAPFAHPFDDGTAVLVKRSIEETAYQLKEDDKRYTELMNSLNANWDHVCAVLLKPLDLIKHPLALTKFGIRAIMSADFLARTSFRGQLARGTFAGVAAHSALPLTNFASASIGLSLNLAAHSVGWPMPEGGAQKLADALADYFKDLGGEIITDCPVKSLGELPLSKLILCDVTPKQLLNIAGSRLSNLYKSKLSRYRYGAGSFKVDWALDKPIPWNAPDCAKAGTVHLGGTLAEIKASELAVHSGTVSEHPYVLLAQHSLFDKTRAPAGKHTAWAYCHVPNGSTVDMTEAIENEVERFASGFRQCIIKRNTLSAQQFQAYNPNYVGGDINGGALDFAQLLARPTLSLIPYATSYPGLYFCSSSTPPGSGVHGMCGYYAALAALKRWSLQ
jgi:phytoene dehydrogenase-like protein